MEAEAKMVLNEPAVKFTVLVYRTQIAYSEQSKLENGLSNERHAKVPCRWFFSASLQELPGDDGSEPPSTIPTAMVFSRGTTPGSPRLPSPYQA